MATTIFTDLVAYWDFNTANGGNDTTGRGNNLTGTGFPAVGDVGGKPSQTILVRATPSYWSKTDTADVRFGAKNWSFAIWFNLATKPAGQMCIFGKDNATANRELTCIWNNSNDRIQVFPFDGNVTSRGTLTGTALGAPVIGTWYFLVVTYALGTNSMRLYLRNDAGGAELADTLTPTGALGSGTHPLELGIYQTLGTRAFDGSLGCGGKWNRVLSATDRNHLYNGGSGRAFATL